MESIDTAWSDMFNFADAVIPVPLGDGRSFVLPQAPKPPESLQLFAGLIQRQGEDEDYVLMGTLIVFNYNPTTTPIAWYRY